MGMAAKTGYHPLRHGCRHPSHTTRSGGMAQGDGDSTALDSFLASSCGNSRPGSIFGRFAGPTRPDQVKRNCARDQSRAGIVSAEIATSPKEHCGAAPPKCHAGKTGSGNDPTSPCCGYYEPAAGSQTAGPEEEGLERPKNRCRKRLLYGFITRPRKIMGHDGI